MSAPHRFVGMDVKPGDVGPDSDDLRIKAQRFGPDDCGFVAVSVKDDGIARGLSCEVHLTPEDAANAGVALLQDAALLGGVPSYGGKTAVLLDLRQVQNLRFLVSIGHDTLRKNGKGIDAADQAVVAQLVAAEKALRPSAGNTDTTTKPTGAPA